MQLTIKPQDRAHPEKIELQLHPSLIRRLKSYAESLSGSDLNYVAAQIFDQVLPPENGAKKAKGIPAPASQTEAAKQPASKQPVSQEASHAARS